MHRGWSCRSRDCIQLGLHHPRYSANPSMACKFVRAVAVLAREIAKRFDSRLDTDLVPVLEAIRDRLGG